MNMRYGKPAVGSSRVVLITSDHHITSLSSLSNAILKEACLLVPAVQNFNPKSKPYGKKYRNQPFRV